jgi:hypothetical protein
MLSQGCSILDGPILWVPVDFEACAADTVAQMARGDAGKIESADGQSFLDRER